MSKTHCRFCELTFNGLYLNCPKCGTNLMHPDEPKTPPEEYELAEAASPLNQEGWLDEFCATYGIGQVLCALCHHDIYKHYWNGAGRSENSSWGSCRYDKCKCVGREIEQEPNTVYECPLQTVFVPAAAAKASIQQHIDEAVAAARIEGIEYVLRVLWSEEGRMRQIANTVFYAAESISELRGDKPIPLEEFGSYKDYLRQLTASSNQGEDR